MGMPRITNGGPERARKRTLGERERGDRANLEYRKEISKIYVFESSWNLLANSFAELYAGTLIFSLGLINVYQCANYPDILVGI